MIRKVTGNIIRKFRFTFNNKRYYKKLVNRIVIVIIFILLMMTFKKISNSFSNNVIRIVKKCITYEFTIKEDGKRILSGAKRLLIVPEQVKEVFNFNGNIDNWVVPVEGTIYKPYGELKNTDRKITNKGVDIIPKGDCTIVSIGDGIVNKIEDKKNLGYFITIKYEDFEAVYGHLKEIDVNEEDNVLKGQKIGFLGLYSEGGNRYLHFEIWKDGNPINPEEILNLN